MYYRITCGKSAESDSLLRGLLDFDGVIALDKKYDQFM